MSDYEETFPELQKLFTRDDITFAIEYTGTHTEAGWFAYDVDDYEATFTRPGYLNVIRTDYHRGEGLRGQPWDPAREVLESLFMDAASVEDATFTEWAGEYGFDGDVKARRLYNELLAERASLEDFFGPDYAEYEEITAER